MVFLSSYSGLVAKKIGKSFGPVAHCAVSVLTGLFLSISLEKRGIPVEENISDLLKGLTQTRYTQ